MERVEIREGDHCVYVSSDKYHVRLFRADRVSDKIVQTARHGRRYSLMSREVIVFAGSKAKAEAVERALAAALDKRFEAERQARARYDLAVEPAKMARDAETESAAAEFALNVETILEVAKGEQS